MAEEQDDLFWWHKYLMLPEWNPEWYDEHGELHHPEDAFHVHEIVVSNLSPLISCPARIKSLFVYSLHVTTLIGKNVNTMTMTSTTNLIRRDSYFTNKLL